MPAIFTAIGESMRHLGARQQMISQNIAHADTPGYKAQELAPISFAGLVDRGGGPVSIVAPVVALSDRLQAMGAKPVVVTSIPDRDISETKPDGNNVTLEDQLLKMGQIQSDFAALTGLYRKHMALVKTALGKGGAA